MYFDLTDEQKAIADTVEAMVRDVIPESEAVARFDAGVLDADLWQAMSALGLGGVLVPEAAGGLDLGLLTLAAVQEKLGWAAAAVPVVHNALAAWLVATTGSEAQRSRWLEGLTSGDVIAAFALDEQDFGPAGWTPAGAALTVAKPLVAWGANAQLLIVGTEGGGLALVDADAVGVTRTPVSATDRTQPLCDLAFAGVPAEPLGADAAQVTALLDALYVLAAADACGAGNRALAMAVDYAKTRRQFDRAIGSFQGLKHQLADRAIEMEPARYLVWYAAHAWDAIPEQRSYAASLAKAHVTEVAVRTARAAVEAHGGIGYTWEYPLHIYLKRAMADRAVFGLPARHRVRSANLAGWKRDGAH